MNLSAHLTVGDFVPSLPGNEVAAAPAVIGSPVTVLHLAEHGASHSMSIDAAAIRGKIGTVVTQQ